MYLRRSWPGNGIKSPSLSGSSLNLEIKDPDLDLTSKSPTGSALCDTVALESDVSDYEQYLPLVNLDLPKCRRL